MLGLLIVREILQLTLGGKVFGQFIGVEEASQTANIAARDALINGNLDAYDEAAAARDEVLKDPTFWDDIASLIPFKNVLDKLEKYRNTAVTAANVYDQIAEDKRIQQETGESDDDKWKRVRKEEADQDKAAVDYYNEQRKLMVTWEIEAKAAARAATRSAEKKARNEDAAFWARERARQRELEAADRKAIADFWIAYRKTLLKFQSDNRPSNLNFGLL